MNKKIAIIIGIVAVIVIIAVVLIFNMNKEVVLNLEEVDTQMSEKIGIDEAAMANIDKTILENLYQIEPDMVANVVGKVPMMNVHASMYLVIEAVEGKEEEVLSKVKEYSKTQEEQWKMYLPAQYELVQNRKEGIVGKYVYLIISEKPEELENVIINNK